MTTPGGWANPSEMVAAEQRARARYEQLRNGITQQQARNIGALYNQNPSMPPGALYAMGVGGVQPGSSAMRAASEAHLQQLHERKEFSFGRMIRQANPYSVLKGASRGIFGLAQGFGQATQAAFREAVADEDLTLREVVTTPKRIGEQLANPQATSFGQMVRQIKRGGLGNVDVGSGFFIGGAAARAQEEYAINSAPMDIKGRRVGATNGRYLAKSIGLEPGEMAFNTVSGLVDATIALATDPTMYVAGPTRALQARRSLSGDASKRTVRELGRIEARATVNPAATDVPRWAEGLASDMGALDGLRKTVNSDRVFEWLTKKDEGRTLVRYLAGETDFERAWRATKGKLDPRLLLQLTERVHGEDEIVGLLGPTLGRTALTEQKLHVDALARLQSGIGSPLGNITTARFKNAVDTTRMFGTVPERVLPKDDLPASIRNMDNFLRNAKISQAERSGILRRLAETDGDADRMFEVATDAMALGVSKAEGLGIDTVTAKKLFKLYANSHTDRMKFWVDQISGRNRVFAKDPNDFKLDRDEMRPLPHLAAQFLDRNIPLPDPREIRAAISPYRNLLMNKKIRMPESALQTITDNIFKPLVLLRPAYVARNQIDEQFRPAGVGLNSMFNHPVQYLNWLITDQRGVGRVLARAGYTQRGARDVNGLDFDPLPRLRAQLSDAKRSGDPDRIRDAQAAVTKARNERRSATPFTDGASEYARSLSGGVGNWRNARPAEIEGSALFDKTRDADYSRALAERLQLIFTDPVAKRVARGDLWPGDLRPGTATGLDGIKDWWWAGAGQAMRRDLAKNSRRMEWLTEVAGATRYIDDTATFVDDAVGTSPVLREAAATGKINGVPLMQGGGVAINPRAIAELDRLKVDPAFLGPPAVPGKLVYRGPATGRLGEAMSRAVDSAFYGLSDRPSAYLSRSPVFRQRYYKRLEALMSFADDAARQKIVQGAKDANLRPKDIRRLESKARPGGTLTFDEADLVAKADALDFTKGLFYSLHDRSQFFDILRLLMPFGEAFKDSAVKYSQIWAKNPVVGYRLGQGIQGGRNADIDGDGRGFFYTDEQYNEEMFAYPGSGALLDGLGVGAIRSPLKNLNILGTSVLPGFGPVVQISAAAVLPDTPDYEAIRDLINPYGERNFEGGAFESFFPAWFNKIRAGGLPIIPKSPEQQRAFAEAHKDMMGYLNSTGEYDISTEEGRQELMDDARPRARAVFYIRGLAQAFLPSPPSPEFVAYDKNGTLLTQFFLAKEMRKIQDEQDAAGTPENANRIFIERFGADAVLAAISNTKAGEGQSPVDPTDVGEDFFQANRKAAERFPSVFGLFAPPSPENAKLDFPAYNRQMRTGERVPITPTEAVERANQKIASMIYTQALGQATGGTGDVHDASDADREELKRLRAKLSEDFPGYSTSFYNDFPKVIEDLKRASKDPVLSQTPQGQALNIWLTARTRAEEAAQAQYGAGWAKADRTAPIREEMRRLADRLAGDFPGFQEMYDRALEQEMVRD